MERNKTLKQVNAIFCDVLNNEKIVLTDNTTANDLEDWDSLTHIIIVVAIERHFKIKFVSKEILSWQNVGEMANAIEDKS